MFSALALMSIGVWRMQPKREPNVVQLVRVSDSNPLRLAQCELFNREHPGLHVTLDPTSGIDKVIVQSLGGVGPDLFDAFDPFELSAYVQAGIALDVTDALKRRGIDLHKLCYPAVLPNAVYGGRVYGVPTNFASDAIWFHRDVLHAAGIPEHRGPWTWSQFIPIAQRLTVRKPDGAPIRYGFSFEWWQWRDFFAGFGAKVYNAAGTRCTLGDGPSVAAVSLMYDLVYKYRVSSNPVEDASLSTAGGFGSGGLSVFGSKHAAFALGGRWWLAQLRSYQGLRLGVVESPFGTVHQFAAYGRATLINKSSHHLAADLDFLAFQCRQPYNVLVNKQADGISAFRAYDRGVAFLHDPDHPEETDNATWRDVAERSVSADSCPFVSGQVAAQIITDQLDLVQANSKTPRAALTDAATQINAAIARNLADDPVLARQYAEASSR